MYPLGRLLAYSLCAMAFATGSPQAGDMKNYKDVPTFSQAQPRECDGDDVGSVQVSCRYIELGSIDGYQLGGQKKEDDPRWGKLQKYQIGGRTRLKFGGIACARGQTVEEASRTALSRAVNLMKEDLREWEDATFTGQLTGLGFNKYDDGYTCVKTRNTSGEDQPIAADDRSTPDAGPQAPDALREAAAYQAEIQRQAERKVREATEARKRQATFIIKNDDRYTLGLAFYSKTYRREWPGNGKQYVLSGTETYNLKCTPGEKICFGAWRDHQTIYWGVGRNGKQGCQSCCIQCGQTYETNLTDGGRDAYPQTSSGGQVLNNVIGAIGLGAVIYEGLNRGGGGGTYSAPPRANPQRQSDVSSR